MTKSRGTTAALRCPEVIHYMLETAREVIDHTNAPLRIP